MLLLQLISQGNEYSYAHVGANQLSNDNVREYIIAMNPMYEMHAIRHLRFVICHDIIIIFRRMKQ